jgi:hypothetical protein
VRSRTDGEHAVSGRFPHPCTFARTSSTKAPRPSRQSEATHRSPLELPRSANVHCGERPSGGQLASATGLSANRRFRAPTCDAVRRDYGTRSCSRGASGSPNMAETDAPARRPRACRRCYLGSGQSVALVMEGVEVRHAAVEPIDFAGLCSCPSLRQRRCDDRLRPQVFGDTTTSERSGVFS